MLQSASALATYAPDDPKWEAESGKVAQTLVSVNSLLLRPWIEALRPVRGKLTAPLETIFRDKNRSETAHSLATDILTDYASDDPDRLAELLMVSDSKAYVSLFPVAEKRAEQILPVFQAELARKANDLWDDPPLNPTWTKPHAALVSRIESAEGLLSERFAFCQTMPMSEFLTAAEGLRAAGYRPVRFRPYSLKQVVQVAAVWTRDGRNWQISSGLTAAEVRQQAGPNVVATLAGTGKPTVGPVARSADLATTNTARAGTFLPVDVAGYQATDNDGKPVDRYAALWVEKSGEDDARLYVGMSALEEGEVHDRLKDAKLIPRAQNAMIGTDGRPRYCGVWGRPPDAIITGDRFRDHFERNFEQKQAAILGDQLLIDLAVSGAGTRRPTRERAQADRERAENKLKTKPDDLDARSSRAVANFLLGENRKALDDLEVVIAKYPKATAVQQYRVITLARLDKKQDAKSELEKFQKGDAPEHSKLYLAAVVAAELGEGADKAFEAMERAIGKQPRDAELRYVAARAFSLASQALARSDKAKGRQVADRSLRLLREAVQNDNADFGKMDDEPDLDPVREDPAFAEIVKAGHPDRRYAAVWSSDASFEATSIYGLDPAVHLRKCRELIAQSYRPVSWSASQTATDGPLVTASVWHRPTVQEEVKDGLAQRQARAAVALVRMGRAAAVWPLLRHSADPRLRSFIVNWLNPLGALPQAVAAELDRLDSSGVGRRSRDPAQGTDRRSPASGVADSGRPSVPGGAATLRVPGDPRPTRPGDPRPPNAMDAILFHPETSQRRALILALGTYGTEGLSSGEREPLIGKLLDVYRNDPDSGIHGAAEWALRQCGQQENLKGLHAELMKLKDRGNRRWFVNSQGQTFAVIDGPVEFRMGSPPTEPNRNVTLERPRRLLIPRRFAIAAKEVTIEQWQRFERTNTRLGLPPSFVHQYSPDPDGPMIGFTWYHAANYCNWLSEQEGLPKGEWCYLANEAGAYAEGMTIPADVLERSGYRLPTEPEWEFACRSGTVTSRYFGLSIELLGKYARYQANSREHAWSCGSLLPNDLGLFDMLGNEFEWVQDSVRRLMPERRGLSSDLINISEFINGTPPRVLRAGAFNNPAATVRSAYRFGNAPSSRNASSGFRLARTYH